MKEQTGEFKISIGDNQFLRILIIASLSLATVVVSIIFINLLILGAYYSALLSLIGILIVLPYNFKEKYNYKYRTVLLLIELMLLSATLKFYVDEVNNIAADLASKPRSIETLSTFTFHDKLSIYSLNLLMGTMGFPFYPEIAKETLLMILPSPENGIRAFYSDFALGSEKAQKFLTKFKKKLDKGVENEIQYSGRIAWNTNNYPLGHPEARYALTLNPSQVSIKATKQDDIWDIDISLQVPCEYPINSKITLLRIENCDYYPDTKLQIEEGLFWVLQQSGWLHPYTADWRFTISSDDERIN